MMTKRESGQSRVHKSGWGGGGVFVWGKSDLGHGPPTHFVGECQGYKTLL